MTLAPSVYDSFALCIIIHRRLVASTTSSGPAWTNMFHKHLALLCRRLAASTICEPSPGSLRGLRRGCIYRCGWALGAPSRCLSSHVAVVDIRLRLHRIDRVVEHQLPFVAFLLKGQKPATILCVVPSVGNSSRPSI